MAPIKLSDGFMHAIAYGCPASRQFLVQIALCIMLSPSERERERTEGRNSGERRIL